MKNYYYLDSENDIWLVYRVILPPIGNGRKVSFWRGECMSNPKKDSCMVRKDKKISIKNQIKLCYGLSKHISSKHLRIIIPKLTIKKNEN